MYQEINEFGEWEEFNDLEYWRRWDCFREIVSARKLIEREQTDVPFVTRMFQVLKVRIAQNFKILNYALSLKHLN